ncbi:MAG: ribosome maturation factor RimP [Actinomycetota bacterium]
MDVEALLRPLIEAEGFELYDVTQGREGGRTVLRVVVDGPGGVDIDTLAHLTERVSRHLDLEGYGTGPYDLQVSSPGVERSLKRPEHFRRAVGERVRVRTTAPMAGATTHTGELVGADDEGITLAVAAGELRLAHADVRSARTVVDWSAELKRSNA